MGFKMYPEPGYFSPYHLHCYHSLQTTSSLTWIILVFFLTLCLFLCFFIVHIITHGILYWKFKLDNVTFLFKTLTTPYHSRPFALRPISSDSCKPHSLHLWLQLLWFFSLSSMCQPLLHACSHSPITFLIKYLVSREPFPEHNIKNSTHSTSFNPP